MKYPIPHKYSVLSLSLVASLLCLITLCSCKLQETSSEPTLRASAQTQTAAEDKEGKPRARDLGIPFDGTPGKFNAITDVTGVQVGHSTIIAGDGKLVTGKGPVRTGVTAILPKGKKYEPVFGACSVLNGNGEMTGATWVEESGHLESPICITNTNSVGTVRDALIKWQLERSLADADGEGSLPLVAETYDGYLNDLAGFHVKKEHVFNALDSAQTGFVAEGNVGGGTGMVCHQFKGGIGTSSRVLSKEDGGYTVGVLVQANHGRRNTLMIAGAPVGKELTEQMPVINSIAPGKDSSIIVVVATDAPLLPHQLKRLARRVPLGLARVGTMALNGSGEIFIAFSTANSGSLKKGAFEVKTMDNESLNPLFEATVQATEEAVVNSMIAAKTMTGINGNTVYAIPHDKLINALAKYNRLKTNIIRVPTCRQSTDHTCGVASLQSILSYYGEEIREDELSRTLGTTQDNGTDYKKIEGYARKKGFQVDLKLNAGTDDLKRSIDKGIPSIVVIQAWNSNPKVDYDNDWDDGHYVVAIGYDEKNLFLMDPSTLGHYTYIPWDEFNKRWHDSDGEQKLTHMMISIGKPQPVYEPSKMSKLE